MEAKKWSALFPSYYCEVIYQAETQCDCTWLSAFGPSDKEKFCAPCSGSDKIKMYGAVQSVLCVLRGVFGPLIFMRAFLSVLVPEMMQ